jgi:two-component system nitrogen regulation response regulator GlnG
MPTLLVIDDELSILHAFRRAFRQPEFALHSAATAAEGLDVFARDRPDVVILDIHLSDAGGLETFDRIRALDARIPVILITGHGTTDLAIEAIKRGAYEYLLKPLELSQLRELVDRACATSRLMNVPAVVADEEPAPEQADVLVGRCPPMQEVYKSIGRVAPQDVTVLIRGESGTGKELVARAVYQHSKRAGQAFAAINCAAIPETLLESELFGHEKGAFTGADRQRIGRFEQCSGGTLFLDEVGEMSPLTQAKVLRVLQEQRFERVGGDETIVTNVRLIGATNADLEALVTAGRFRRDLYFRLNVFTIALPPLRDRGDDLDLLVDHYVRHFGRQLGKPVQELPAETRALLRRYPWPGNVRELQSVLKQALLRMSGTILLSEFLPAQVQNPANVEAAVVAAIDWEPFIAERLERGTEDLYAECLERLERQLLTRVLQHTNGNQVQAARLLGITRGTLRQKLRTLGITIGRSVWSEDDQGGRFATTPGGDQD